MIRLAAIILLVVIVYRLFKSMGRFSGGEQAASQTTAEMVRDPECGTYLLPAQAVSLHLAGKEYFFCSEECKQKFIKEQAGKTGKQGKHHSQ
ncbi:MAG: YHS domain-containing protein [Deltaproteobacteria bacterium]|nr:YHS domain-containing protein [Deltaproteobacteria bacterium]MBW2071904.1 YHS domain-containing protein [Deltaproteobacteria bacterium]